jgi:predicted permease
VAVISHDLWQRRFGGDPAVVGRTATINGHLFAIVGVAPPDFHGTTIFRPDVWVPTSSIALVSRMHDDILQSRRAVWLMMGGRLKPGVSVAQADAELRAIGAALQREYPREYGGKGVKALPLAAVPGMSGTIAQFLGLLMALVGLVLLIACVNVSGMLLARGAAREREIAVRMAIGARRSQIARQLLIETAVFFVVSGAAGLILSRWFAALLLGVLPELPFPVSLDLATDWRVVAFAAAVSFAGALLAGLMPAVQASRPDLVPMLKNARTNGGRLRFRSAFLVGQITLSLVLVLAGGLFLRALQRATSIDPGFDQTNVDTVTFDLTLANYTQPAGIAFVSDVVARTAALPGVQSAATAVDLPLDGGRMGLGGLRVPGRQPPDRGTAWDADWNVVSPGFFRTLGIRLVSGRDFSARDTTGSGRVAIVNEAFARRIWGDTDVVGRQIQMQDGPDNAWTPMTIVGVAPDVQLITLGEAAEPYVYVPLSQQYLPGVTLLVKTEDGRSIARDVRAIVHQMNPNLPISRAMPLTQVTAIGLVPQRIAASLAGSLGLVGLLLAAIGIYGVTSYAVNRRTREIGIRMALGADRGDVRRLVLRQGLMLTTIGVFIGLGVGAAGSRVLQSLLYGVSSVDPMTFGTAAILCLAVAIAASYLPARRATRVEPVTALRAE